MRSRRRGRGLDLAGARPYQPGDDVRAIDHRATARASSARGDDQLIVREYLTEESARVVVVVDRSPSMSLFPRGLPWLSKPDALVEAVRVIVASAADARCSVGLLDCCSPHVWLAPDGRVSADEVLARASRAVFDAPAGALDEALLSMLRLEQRLQAGTFVFVVSDFIGPLSPDVWNAMLRRRWDVVPVVVQDPVWEHGFPDVSGALLAVADPSSGETRDVRLTEGEVAERRAANEARLEHLRRRFASLGLDRVELSSADPTALLEAFTEWATGRREGALTVR